MEIQNLMEEISTLPHTKINSQWLGDLTVKSGRQIFVTLGSDFLAIIPKAHSL